MVRVERKVDNVFQIDYRTGRDLRDHLRGVIDNRAFLGCVIEFAIDLRFGAELFDNFDTSLYHGIGRSIDERLILMDIFGTNAQRDFLIGIEVFVDILDSCNNAAGKQNLVVADEAYVYALCPCLPIPASRP